MFAAFLKDTLSLLSSQLPEQLVSLMEHKLRQQVSVALWQRATLSPHVLITPFGGLAKQHPLEQPLPRVGQRIYFQSDHRTRTDSLPFLRQAPVLEHGLVIAINSRMVSIALSALPLPNDTVTYDERHRPIITVMLSDWWLELDPPDELYTPATLRLMSVFREAILVLRMFGGATGAVMDFPNPDNRQTLDSRRALYAKFLDSLLAHSDGPTSSILQAGIDPSQLGTLSRTEHPLLRTPFALFWCLMQLHYRPVPAYAALLRFVEGLPFNYYSCWQVGDIVRSWSFDDCQFSVPAQIVSIQPDTETAAVLLAHETAPVTVFLWALSPDSQWPRPPRLPLGLRLEELLALLVPAWHSIDYLDVEQVQARLSHYWSEATRRFDILKRLHIEQMLQGRNAVMRLTVPSDFNPEQMEELRTVLLEVIGMSQVFVGQTSLIPCYRIAPQSERFQLVLLYNMASMLNRIGVLSPVWKHWLIGVKQTKHEGRELLRLNRSNPDGPLPAT